MKKIIVMLLFLGLISLAGCSSTIKIQNKRVSQDKIYEVEVDSYSIGHIVQDSKLVQIYYLNVVLKDLQNDGYENQKEENRYNVKIIDEEVELFQIQRLQGAVIEVKAKELKPGWINN